MKFFWNQKVLHLAIKEISTLKSFYKVFLIKLSHDVSDTRFVLVTLLKPRYFQTFQQVKVFYFLRVWN